MHNASQVSNQAHQNDQYTNCTCVTQKSKSHYKTDKTLYFIKMVIVETKQSTNKSVQYFMDHPIVILCA